MKIKKNVFFLLIFILLTSNIANANSIQDTDEKIEEQNKSIYNEIYKYKKDKDNTMEKIFDDMTSKDNENNETSLSQISNNLSKNSIILALKVRKVIVPITILTLTFNTIMLSTVGTKNLSKRKKYLYGSFVFYIVFLIILNFPIYLLWRYSLGTDSIISLNTFYKFSIGVTNFFRKHSFVFSIIILSYGLINFIVSENDIPRRMVSSYLIKMSFILFVLFQSLPWLLKLAV